MRVSQVMLAATLAATMLAASVAGQPTRNPDDQPGAAITFSSQPHPGDQNGVTVRDVQIVDTI